MALEDFISGLTEEQQLDLVRRAKEGEFEAYARQLTEKLMQPEWSEPDEGYVVTLEELLGQEDEKVEWLVDHIIGKGFNHVLTAQYKTGKSTFVMNLAKSLADASSFLRHFEVGEFTGNIGYWNAEMLKSSFISYMKPLEVEAPGRIHTVNLRGQTMDILNEPRAREWTEQWLRDNEIKVWIIDTWGRLCAWCGVSENKNDEVSLLLNKIDEIKYAVDDKIAVVITAHTGRADHTEGAERARGATVLDDWADVRMILTKEKRPDHSGPRFLHGEGRSVHLEEFKILRDGEDGPLFRAAEGGSRREDRMQRAVHEVHLAVANHPGLNTSALKMRISAVPSPGERDEAIQRATDLGLVRSVSNQRTSVWYPVSGARLPDWARSAVEREDEGDDELEDSFLDLDEDQRSGGED